MPVLFLSWRWIAASATETTCHLFSPHCRRCPMARKSARSSDAAVLPGWCECTPAATQKLRGELFEPNHPRRTPGCSGSPEQNARRARPWAKAQLVEANSRSILDRWIELCAKPRLRAKSLKDYEGLLRRYVRPGLGRKPLASISAFDIQTLYGDLLAGGSRHVRSAIPTQFCAPL